MLLKWEINKSPSGISHFAHSSDEEYSMNPVFIWDYCREKLNQKIAGAEEDGKKLREEQKTNRESQEDSARQIKMWRDLQKIMESKKRCWEQINGRQASADERSL